MLLMWCCCYSPELQRASLCQGLNNSHPLCTNACVGLQHLHWPAVRLPDQVYVYAWYSARLCMLATPNPSGILPAANGSPVTF